MEEEILTDVVDEPSVDVVVLISLVSLLSFMLDVLTGSGDDVLLPNENSHEERRKTLKMTPINLCDFIMISS